MTVIMVWIMSYARDTFQDAQVVDMVPILLIVIKDGQYFLFSYVLW